MSGIADRSPRRKRLVQRFVKFGERRIPLSEEQYIEYLLTVSGTTQQFGGRTIVTAETDDLLVAEVVLDPEVRQ